MYVDNLWDWGRRTEEHVSKWGILLQLSWGRLQTLCQTGHWSLSGGGIVDGSTSDDIGDGDVDSGDGSERSRCMRVWCGLLLEERLQSVKDVQGTYLKRALMCNGRLHNTSTTYYGCVEDAFKTYEGRDAAVYEAC